MTEPAATHWWGTVWTFLVSHFGGIVSFVSGMIVQRTIKWFDDSKANKKTFSMQISDLRLQCQGITENYWRLSGLLTEYDKSSGPDLQEFNRKYQKIISQILQQVEAVKAALPDKSVVYEVQKEKGLREYNLVTKAVSDIEIFAQQVFTEITAQSPHERETKAIPFKAIQEPFRDGNKTRS